MANTFNELLRSEGIDPREVSLLRHQTDKAGRGRTPYTLWRDDRKNFELYQSTQQPRPVFRNAKYWASFVAPEKYKTLFVGLYEVKIQIQPNIDWLDPLTGRNVGFGKDVEYDFFHTKRTSILKLHIGNLLIEWDRRAVRSWAQYALGKDKPIVGNSLSAIDGMSAKEGSRYWSRQSKIERNPMLAQQAKHENRRKYGCSRCEACGFENDDAALFDAHHPEPLALGERETFAKDLIILCPICHRKAHRADRLRPTSLIELQNWVRNDRP